MPNFIRVKRLYEPRPSEGAAITTQGKGAVRPSAKPVVTDFLFRASDVRSACGTDRTHDGQPVTLLLFHGDLQSELILIGVAELYARLEGVDYRDRRDAAAALVCLADAKMFDTDEAMTREVARTVQGLNQVDIDWADRIFVGVRTLLSTPT
jgi:hypothetical protein